MMKIVKKRLDSIFTLKEELVAHIKSGEMIERLSEFGYAYNFFTFSSKNCPKRKKSIDFVEIFVSKTIQMGCRSRAGHFY
jgi:hypothetical protein